MKRHTTFGALALAASVVMFLAVCHDTQELDPCSVVDCGNHGQCEIDDDGWASCACGDGYESVDWDCRRPLVVFDEIDISGTNLVDILFVVDASNSMAVDQVRLVDNFTNMAQELLDPSDPDAQAVQDLHLGVVTTDMGTGGHTVSTCSNPEVGDNGELQSRGHGDTCEDEYFAPGCDFEESDCRWLVHSEEHPDDGTDSENPPIWDDFACIAALGTGGCGFEQHLESSYVALVDQTRDSGTNVGFLRDDALLVVMYITDEDDCSASDDIMFDMSADHLPLLNVRCALATELLHPISRYHDAFLELKGGREEMVVVGVVAGFPTDGSWDREDGIEALRDLVRVNPADPSELLHGCDGAGRRAFPPPRLAELALSFGENGVLQSICDAEWTNVLPVIARRIQEQLTGACLRQRPDAYDEPGACRVVETLSDDRACPHPAEPPGDRRESGFHEDMGLDDDNRRQCEVLTADYDTNGCPDGGICTDEGVLEGDMQGWFFYPDPSCGENGMIRFTSGVEISLGSSVRFECRTDTE